MQSAKSKFKNTENTKVQDGPSKSAESTQKIVNLVFPKPVVAKSLFYDIIDFYICFRYLTTSSSNRLRSLTAKPALKLLTFLTIVAFLISEAIGITENLKTNHHDNGLEFEVM